MQYVYIHKGQRKKYFCLPENGTTCCNHKVNVSQGTEMFCMEVIINSIIYKMCVCIKWYMLLFSVNIATPYKSIIIESTKRSTQYMFNSSDH